jgi:hypothetical protein
MANRETGLCRGGVWLALAVLGCAPRAAAPPTVEVRPAEGAPAPVPAATLPAPTEAERELAGRLQKTVQHLAVEIGERNADKSWNLATATDDLAISLEKLGYEVRRQGIVVEDGAVVQNLAVHVNGGEKGGQAVVVGAHFDTLPGTPGADENASGAAAVLELARTFYAGKPKRAIHFALFVNAAPAYAATDKMGSFVYAKALKTEGLDVRAMISLDGLGAFAPGPPARPYPAEVRPPYPPRSDFVALLGNEDSRTLLEQLARSFEGSAVPVIGSVQSPELAGASDHAGFWKLGIPAVLLTDLARFRYKEHQTAADLPDRLDFDRMARVVGSVKKAIGDLADAG